MNDAILAKIRKILAKAEDPAATDSEAAAYTAKAAELIASYGVDQALLQSRSPGTHAVGDRVVVLDPPYALDKTALLSAVAIALRCRAVQQVRYVDGAKQISLHLFGFGSDLARAEILFTSLLFGATASLGRTPVPRGEHVAAFRRSWLAGFTLAVQRRLRAAERQAETTEESQEAGRSVTLVLRDRSEQVESALHRAYPHLRRAQPRSLTGTGGRAGWLEGQRADLGGRRFAGGKAALTS